MIDISPSRARGGANCRCILAPPGDPDRQRREALRLSENGPWPPRRWTVGKNGDTDELAPFAHRTVVDTRNLADLYGLPVLDWDTIAIRLARG